MKRLVALMLAVAVCLSVVGVAMAEDGQPGVCNHAFTETKNVKYDQITNSHHRETWSHEKFECPKCGATKPGFKPYLEVKTVTHSSRDGKTYNYHLGDYHYFYQVCRCNLRINQTKALCPGGDSHIGIVLSLPPVVLEVK